MPNRKINFYSKFAIKMPNRKINVCSEFAIKNTDIGSLKFLHTFLKKCLHHMLVKFEQNFELFDKKPFWVFCFFLVTIFEKDLTPFWEAFL